MRSQTRIICTAIIFVIAGLILFNLKGKPIPDYLPKQAHDYFHPSDQSGEQPHISNTTLQPQAEETIWGEERRKKLEAHLEKFLKSPILSYEEALELNSKTCPTEGINNDKNSVNDNSQQWSEIPSSRISEWRQDIVAYLRKRQEEELSAANNRQITSRGIVMAVGDRSAAVRARTIIRLLQSYSCTLPVEVFHFLNELTAADQDLLKDLSQLEEGQEGTNVTFRLIDGLQKESNLWKSFHIKGAAIQQSSFDEVLYLDTDSYPLRDPNYLFEGENWKATGLLLWPDYTKSHPKNPLWRLLGQNCRNEYEGESGQILISRSRHQDLMWLVEYFAINNFVYYGFMGGDRDSFRAAALLLGKTWAGPGRLIAAAGVLVEGNPGGGGHTMLQADPEGEWMFVHGNLLKHTPFQRPLWSSIHHAANDKYAAGTTYGNIDPPNDRIGDGVKLVVAPWPNMATEMSAIDGYDNTTVVVESWNTYEYLNGFEEKWFGLGGEHL
jgi:alpha 1,2-mannosyltransferase